MLISKFDLYRHEWLELVFENRNKGYGAYDLRQHYAGNMVKAMGITFLSIGLLIGASVIIKPGPGPIVQRTPDQVTEVHIAKIEVIKPPALKKQMRPDQPAAVAPTTKNIPPIVVDDSHATKEQMKENTALTIDIGPIDTKGTPGGTNIPAEGTSTGPATPPADNTLHPLNGLDVMPMPVGGEAAWSKFLSRNLRYPDQAQDARVSGRVLVSFVIEKDGHLSNIVVERAAGYGFDEEAVRVLKMAKAWKPGMQNGQPVRVKYMIPINFQLSE